MSFLPDIDKNFSDWYNDVVFKADLCDQAPIKGCIIIKPYGYGMWELIQQILDKQFKTMGVLNCAFPLLIPYSFIQREKEHVAGFSPELAIVTHAGGKKLEEEYVVRPTSETIIHESFGRWIKSWRDLPIRVNQWCSVIRWEKRPRPFIRTTEFWWQEGHTAHETCEEANDQAHEAHKVYRDFIRDCLAIPFYHGPKPFFERFAGATETLTVEGMMRDGKSLQMATSHVLSQNFAEVFDIKFENKNQQRVPVSLTSWGCTTRLIGSVVMVHGDQKGIIIPFKIAPIQVVIVPIFKINSSKNEELTAICKKISKELQAGDIRVKLDLDEHLKAGEKFSKYELSGMPLRLEIGERDLQENILTIYKRASDIKIKVKIEDVNVAYLLSIMEDEHKVLYNRAEERMLLKTRIDKDFIQDFGEDLDKNPEFYRVGWCNKSGNAEDFKRYKATVRCVLENTKPFCCLHGKNCKAEVDIIVAKAY
jgi:prolyl-tRNA synthetase